MNNLEIRTLTDACVLFTIDGEWFSSTYTVTYDGDDPVVFLDEFPERLGLATKYDIEIYIAEYGPHLDWAMNQEINEAEELYEFFKD